MKHKIDGVSFMESLTDTNRKKDQVAYSYFRNGISLRTEKYRLTKYYRQDEPRVELYDHTTDPYETNNVAQANPALVTSLMPILEKGNTGLYEEN
jgi:hypothetical protein